MPPIPGTETILVIDDERLILSLTHAMLTRHGYTTLTAISSAEAMQLFRDWPTIEVDLMLVDFTMPDITGPEMVKLIHQVRSEIPVLFFSAYSKYDAARPLLAHGVPFLAKPFSSLQLIKKIREVLDTPKADSAAE
jgi:two-component system cell cycle sensor histidine kinase/response regulator CckA